MTRAGLKDQAGRERDADESPPIDWSATLNRYAMQFDRLPQGWREAPHLGNAMLGSMIYQVEDTLHLQVFRADVHDHRDERHGWTAYSRPHFMIGYFALQPVGLLTGCSWRMDLWNAELTGTIITLVAIPETMVILGFVVAAMILLL